MTKKERSKDNSKQSERFIEAAKEAGADETEEGANKAFKEVIKRPPASKSRA